MQRPRPLITISRPLLQRLSALMAVLAFVAASIFGIRLLGGSALGERIMAALPRRTPAVVADADIGAASARSGTELDAGRTAEGAGAMPVGADFAPAIKVLKTLTTQDPARVGEEVGFRIELRNASHLPLADLRLSDSYDANHLQFLSAQPAPAEVDENSGTLNWSALEAQLDDGSLDPGDMVVVDVRFIALAATVDAAARNLATVSANGGQVTDGPHTALVRIGEEPVAGLCLGDMVFVDLADDGRLDSDAGDLGIGGVALSLYRDADSDDRWSAADPLLRTTRTDSDGRYGFCELAPGDYLVLIEPVNFAADGPLVGLRSSGAGSGADNAADPDDDVDGDDNGGLAGTTAAYAAEPPQVVSRAITLSADGEPAVQVDGTGAGDNRTLDFGFAMREGIGSGSPDPLTTDPLAPDPLAPSEPQNNAPEAPISLREPVRDPQRPMKPVYGKPVYGKPGPERPRRP
ncbi:MAG TPA: SdrD B-like domain-containing protein [Anaerolineae bacterium]|nr:SdrD B-like domain-containing protein [Anaerolineae bacterium]